LSAFNNIGLFLFFSTTKIDVFYFILPIPQNQALFVLYLILRCGAIAMTTWTLWNNLAVCMFITLCTVHVVELAIRCCLRASENFKLFSKRVESASRKYYLVKLVIKTECELNVLQVFANNLTETIAPLAIFLAELIVVACNVTCLRIWKSLPMAVLIFLPLSLIATALAFILLYATGSFYENSVLLKRNLRAITDYDKYWSRVVKSRRCFRFQIGDVCFAKKSTKTSFFDHCIYDTVNTALLF